MTGDQWDVYGRAAVKTLGERYGWTEAEVEEFSKEENFDEMKRRALENITEFQDNMKTLLQNLLPDGTNLSSFASFEDAITAIENGSDEAAKAMVPFLRMMQEIIDVAKGAVTVTGKPFTAERIGEVISNKETYTSDVVNRQKQLNVIGALEEYQGLGEKYSYETIEGNGVTTPHILTGLKGLSKLLVDKGIFASEDDFNNYLENNDYAANLLTMYGEGNIDLPMLIN